MTLVTFIRPEDTAHLTSVTNLVKNIRAIPINRSRINDLSAFLRSLFSNGPFLVGRDDQHAMRNAINDLAQTGGFDVIHADQVSMAQYASLYRSAVQDRSNDNQELQGGKPALAPQLVFDSHNATWLILERSMEFSPCWLKPWLTLESHRMKRYEGRLVKDFDLSLTVSQEDRIALLEAAGNTMGNHLGERIVTVPIAVDCAALQPVKRKSGAQITTMGTLYYPPNADGIRWFAREVFPMVRQAVPAATFTIVGKRPPQDFIQMARDFPDTIQVAGYLPDLTPCLEKTAVMVVPVRTGGGIRVRILEAFARGVPVVTTTVGAEGINAAPGKDLMVGDSPAEFAQAVIDLLQDPEKQNSLAENGRRLAEQCYDWKVVLPAMDEPYRRLVDNQS